MPPPLAPPRFALAILRAVLPRAERDEVLAETRMEFAQRATVDRDAARRWLWRQALRSAPSLLTLGWRRSLTGFESPANAYRPGDPMLKLVLADIRYAARRLAARRSYSLLSILTLALGIGGTAAIYGIARPLLFDALPYANERETVRFWFDGSWTEQEFTYLRDKFAGFRTVAAYRNGDVTLRDGDAPARLLPAISSSFELFDVLGAHPMLGRGFQPGDDTQGAEAVAVVSYGLWRELGGTPSIVGSRVNIDGTPRTVIGVMPRGFWFPNPSIRVWLPQPINPERQNGSYVLVGRVAQGVDPHNMQSQVDALVRVVDERFDYPSDWDKTKGAFVTPIRDALLGSMRPALIATFVAMSLILLIACVNVAALMLGQMERRAGELAVRAALGATRHRLTQPIIVEALLLGVVAGVLGALLAGVGFSTLASSLPLGAWGESANFDWTMFVMALFVAIGAVLLVVTIPATSLLRGDRGDVHRALSRARTGGIHGNSTRIERGLVVAEVALAMLIASGAALLVRSVNNLYAIDPGIETAGIGIVDVVVSADITASARSPMLREVEDALRSLPGVRSVAYSAKLPLRGSGNSFGIQIPGQAASAEGSTTYFRIGSADYPKTVGMTITRGRTFDISDTRDSVELPILINETLAKRYFAGQDPIGRQVSGGFNRPQRIVGVVKDVAEGALLEEPRPSRYFLAEQAAMGNAYSYVIRTTRPGDAPTILDAARATVQRIAPPFAIQGTTTMQRVFDTAVGPARQIMSLLALLSSLALLLGAVGIYGVISHFVSRRMRDWAIRVALGLSTGRVITQILTQGGALVGAGVIIGGIATAALSRLLTTFLYDVSGGDPAAFAGASALVLISGLVAAFIPARRASTVDPVIVLREQ